MSMAISPAVHAILIGQKLYVQGSGPDRPLRVDPGFSGAAATARRALQRGKDEFDTGSDAATSRIDRQMIAIPRMIVAPNYGLPIGGDQAGYFARAGFDP